MTVAGTLGVLAAALAVWLWCRPGPAVTSRLRLDMASAWVRGRRGGVGAAALGSLCLGVLSFPAAALAGIVLATVWGAHRLWRGRTMRKRAAAERTRVREACEHLAAELAAGQPPGAALRRSSEACPALAEAAEVLALGGDVPSALRVAADVPGREPLRLLAAGWQVAHRTGLGLGATVDRIADSLRAEEQTARLVAGELASARATARLVATLPAVALAMGSGAGGSPWRFLLMTPPGLACLAGGVLLTLVGLAWIEALTAEAR